MNKAVLLTSMLFFHIVADFIDWGSLKKKMQESWWDEDEDRVNCEYITALACHSFVSSFLIHVPAIISIIGGYRVIAMDRYVLSFCINCLIYGFINNKTVNKKNICLGQKEFIHIIQVVVTCLLL